MADLAAMKRQIVLVKEQGVGDGVIVSTMELEALVRVAEVAKGILDMHHGLVPWTEWQDLRDALAKLVRDAYTKPEEAK